MANGNGWMDGSSWYSTHTRVPSSHSSFALGDQPVSIIASRGLTSNVRRREASGMSGEGPMRIKVQTAYPSNLLLPYACNARFRLLPNTKQSLSSLLSLSLTHTHTRTHTHSHTHTHFHTLFSPFCTHYALFPRKSTCFWENEEGHTTTSGFFLTSRPCSPSKTRWATARVGKVMKA